MKQRQLRYFKDLNSMRELRRSRQAVQIRAGECLTELTAPRGTRGKERLMSPTPEPVQLNQSENGSSTGQHGWECRAHGAAEGARAGGAEKRPENQPRSSAG
ncbi:hypothetical protein SKAU_G00259160 [Synaphobranchus kaupii]|uniref:Uncharacterized protein n=1 Tax=Synaphobranchus kaupii TaxID=118154 RepID=A0A9Q1F4L1_SYNKA|nr:hypothetical protein SKAU_G00259160 [Synaphobranchus kaupii]